MKKRFRAKFLFFIPIALAVIALLGFIVMSLWNAILVPVLHAGIITFWQSVGILILSKILFGGFRGRGGWGRGGMRGQNKWKSEMRDKWINMSPEEREKFKHQLKDEWRKGCGGRWQSNTAQEPAAGAGAE